MKKENINLSDLNTGSVIEFASEHLRLVGDIENGHIYDHCIFGERGPIMASFQSTHSERTPFVIEKIKNGIISLRTATPVCDSEGNLLKGRNQNYRTDVTTTLLFNENTGNSYGYIYAIYDNIHKCIESHGNEIIFEEGTISHNIELKLDFDAFSKIVTKMLDTYIKKDHDYGSAFSEMYDELGINYGYGKIREKVNRIKTLKDGDAMVENEPLEGALLDCANYCILTLMEYQKHKENGKD